MRELFEYLKAQTDKIICLILICIFLAVFLHVLHYDKADAAALQWSEKSVDFILGGLMMAVTGKGVQTVINKLNGNGNGREPPPQPKPLEPPPNFRNG